jgi:tetratricopeptide (TPR) repeat protein
LLEEAQLFEEAIKQYEYLLNFYSKDIPAIPILQRKALLNEKLGNLNAALLDYARIIKEAPMNSDPQIEARLKIKKLKEEF